MTRNDRDALIGVTLLIVAFLVVCALVVQAGGDPGMPDCPKDRTVTVRCAP